MKLHILSDLHLECTDWNPPVSAQQADVVVLAGDIWSHTHGLTWAAKVFAGKRVIYIAGNHEYYDAHLGLLAELRRVAKELGIHFLDRNTLEIDGVRFLGCTLWSGFNLLGDGMQQALAMTAAKNGINDFQTIYASGNKWLEPKDALSMHRTALIWLSAELAKPFEGKTVVITHFAPHRGCIPPEREGSALSPYFVTDLSWLMEKYAIDLWCHGHTHTSTDFIAEGGCRVVSNQLGYPGERRQKPEGMEFRTGFREALLIEV